MARWLDETEMAAWRSLLHTHAALQTTLDRELRTEHDLTLAEYEVLMFLSESPDEQLPMAALADRTRITPSALTRRIDRLVTQGYVERVACAADGRVTYAALSKAGRIRLEEAAPTHVRGVREHFVDRLSRTQLEALTQALQAAQGPPPC